MTTQEFSNSFDTLLNSYSIQPGFGEGASKADVTLDEYEKSVLLTQAQDLVVKSYFYSNQNSQGQGFDDSERRQVNFSSLIKVTTLSPSDDNDNIFDDRGIIYQMPKKTVKQTFGMKVLTIVFAVISIIYVLPVFIVLYNSFKANGGIALNLFSFPDGESFNGFANYIKGMTFGNYPFWEAALWSLFITLGGVTIILICTSMAAWYIQRSNTLFCKIVYFFCIFSMVVPFQMVMFTLSDTANKLKLTTPWGILFVYLGFGAGLAIFMFSGFVKSIPIEIEEAADVDGAGPLKTFFGIVLPIICSRILFSTESSTRQSRFICSF